MARDMMDSTESGSPIRNVDSGFRTRANTRYRRYRQLRFTDSEMAIILLTPVLSYLAIISYYPIVDTLWTSLHTGSALPTQEAEFVGLDNYWYLVNSGSFWNALVVTMIYTFVSVPIEMVVGLGIAILINRKFRGRYIAMVAILFPWALPTVINAEIWAWLFHSQYGVINDMLVRIGIIDSPFPFLAQQRSALGSMLFITIWKTTSFVALLCLAGLQAIPDELYEAARIDGASLWEQFWYITLPLLKPVLLVALIFRTLPAFQAFDLPYGLTGGGPGQSTTTLVLWAHNHTFNGLNFGEGAAAATFITTAAMVICLVYVVALYDPEGN